MGEEAPATGLFEQAGVGLVRPRQQALTGRLEDDIVAPGIKMATPFVAAAWHPDRRDPITTQSAERRDWRTVAPRWSFQHGIST